MSDFADKLSVLVAKEMAEAHGDADRLSELIERLTNSLAFSISIVARGDAKAMQELLTGAESYLYDCATRLAPVGELMNYPGMRMLRK